MPFDLVGIVFVPDTLIRTLFTTHTNQCFKVRIDYRSLISKITLDIPTTTSELHCVYKVHTQSPMRKWMKPQQTCLIEGAMSGTGNGLMQIIKIFQQPCMIKYPNSIISTCTLFKPIRPIIIIHCM